MVSEMELNPYFFPQRRAIPFFPLTSLEPPFFSNGPRVSVVPTSPVPSLLFPGKFNLYFSLPLSPQNRSSPRPICRPPLYGKRGLPPFQVQFWDFFPFLFPSSQALPFFVKTRFLPALLREAFFPLFYPVT